MASNPLVFERVEKKYLLDAEQYAGLQAAMQAYVRPDERYFRSTIGNLYYDTPDWLLTRRSNEKPAFKEKLRVRCYEVPNDDTVTFLEIKRKCRGTVYKRRAILPYAQAIAFLAERTSEGDNDFVLHEVACFRDRYPGLRPAMMIAYDRLSFAGENGLRMTFDTNLRWRDTDLDLRHGFDGVPILRDGQRLLEVKALGAMPMWLARALSELAIFPASFSKVGKAFCIYQVHPSKEVLTHV